MTKRLALSMLASSELVIEKENEATELILIIANNIFGSNISKKEDVLIDLILNLINAKYPKCTIQDLRNTYISGEIAIVKRQGTSLNRDEFIEPLNIYFDKKNKLIFEIEKIQRKDAEEQDRIKKDLEFKQTAKNIYLESIKQGKWLGTEHHANAIGRNFSGVLTKDETDEINLIAHEEHKERIKRAEMSGNATELINVPSWQRIYARIYVERMVQRKYKFVEI